MTYTLADYYAALAPEMGEDFRSTATSGSSTVQLEDTSWPIKSTLDRDGEYNGYLLWRPNAANATDKVRFVKSYTASTGILSPDHDWTNAPYTGGAGELYHLFSAVAPVDGSSIDLRSLINEGLKRTYTIVELACTPTASKTRHCIGNVATWLRSETWVMRVGWLYASEDRNQMDPYTRVVRGRVVRDGDTLYLDHYPQTFNSTDVVYVETLKRGYDHCATAAGQLGSQGGLSADTDICPIQDDWAAASALVVAWRRLRKKLARNPDLPRDRIEAAMWLNRLTAAYLNPLPRTFFPAPPQFGPVQTTGVWPAFQIRV